MTNKIVSTLKGAPYLLGILLTCVVFTGLFLYGKTNYAVFQVKDISSGSIILEKKLRVGETFTLEYVHSVTKQRVYEVFSVERPRTLALVEMRYDSFGANLPVGSERLREETTEFIIEDGFYKIVYQNRKFERFLLRVGYVIANHELIFRDGIKVSLPELAGKGTLVEISVKPLYTTY